jgi:hypothetical protein
VAILGAAFGLRNIRSAVLAAAVAFLALSGLHALPASSGAVYVVLGSPPDIVRLFGMFAVGMSFYLWRDHVVYDHKIAAAAAVCVIAVSLSSPVGANLAIAACGGYLVFWAAFKIPALFLSRFGNKTDLSFGIYLYAWPIQMSIAYALDRAINPWLLSCVALVGARLPPTLAGRPSRSPRCLSLNARPRRWRFQQVDPPHLIYLVPCQKALVGPASVPLGRGASF